MARRSLDPAGKPFEVKVGIGFKNFGGMYYLGDPSMCPPDRFRKLINVRLGEKDIKSRPGLDATWDSGTSEAVVGMVEQNKRSAGKLWYGPYAGMRVNLHVETGPPPFAWPINRVTQYPYYGALILDASEWPLEAYSKFFEEAVLSFGSFIDNYSMDLANATYMQDYVNTFQFEATEGLLADCSRMPVGWPNVTQRESGFAVPDPGFPETPGPLAITGHSRNLGMQARRRDLVYDVGTNYAPVAARYVHTHSRLDEVLYSWVLGGILYDYVATGVDEHPVCNCLDPIVYCRGKWIAPGSVFPYNNPGVIASKAAQNGTGTGQQFFEVTFGSQVPQRPQPDATVTGTLDISYPSDEIKNNFFGADFTELFRLPGVCPAVIPPRPDTMDGKMARSMCVRTVRRDSPITASEGTDEKLYIGTGGGYPLIPGYISLLPIPFPVHDGVYVFPVRTITDGEVYSWDGNTVKREVATGIGCHVVVTALPDGAILACGRTGAKMLDPQDETWKTVTVPAYSTMPYYRNPGPGFTLCAPNPDQRFVGWMWTDRVVFRGEVYLMGFDVAKLAPQDYNVSPRENLPYTSAQFYARTIDAWQIFRFDRASLTLVAARTGDQLFTTLQANAGYQASLAPVFGNPNWRANATAPLAPEPQDCLLAQDGDHLYYAWGGGGWDPGGTQWHIGGIGRFNGVTWDDDWYLSNEGTPTGGGAQKLWRDMIVTPAGLWVLAYPNWLYLVTGDVPNWEQVAYGPGDRFWPSRGRTTDAPSYPGWSSCGRMFIGPT